MRSDLLGAERITHILRAFANFPDYTFLWKFESDTLPVEMPKNVFIQKWIPQNDVLGTVYIKYFLDEINCGHCSTQKYQIIYNTCWLVEHTGSYMACHSNAKYASFHRSIRSKIM